VGVREGAGFTPSQAGPFPAENSSAPVLLRLSLNRNSPTFPLACVGNAASFAIGPIAPGELVTLFGGGLGPTQGVETQASAHKPYPTKAANVEVTFDGKPAPLLWVQDVQINAVAPWRLTPGKTTQVCVSYNQKTTNCLTWPVQQVAPGVFTVDGVHAAALNQDGTVNSADHPAPPGSIVAVFATGLGPIQPAQADGTLVEFPLPANVVGVEVVAFSLTPAGPQSTVLEITYAGPAPYLVAGVSQVNFRTVSGANGFALGNSFFQIYVADH
jgi:uncharacterized protein (TIGR03437 family)